MKQKIQHQLPQTGPLWLRLHSLLNFERGHRALGRLNGLDLEQTGMEVWPPRIINRGISIVDPYCKGMSSPCVAHFPHGEINSLIVSMWVVCISHSSDSGKSRPCLRRCPRWCHACLSDAPPTAAAVGTTTRDVAIASMIQ